MKYKIIITAGGTSEKIDNVRKITNSGTGKLGYMISNKLIELKEELIDTIYYICSKNSYKPDNKKIKLIEITDTKDLENEVKRLLIEEKIDYFIHSMAVSDYTVDYVTTVEKLIDNIDKNNMYESILNYKDGIKENKISSYEENIIIKLKKTPKIISMIKDISPKTFLVGFKLLDNVEEKELIDIAINLKDKNKCNIVIANDLTNIRNGNHKAFIIRNDNSYINASSKDDISIKLVSEMFKNV